MCELVECLSPATVVLYYGARPWYLCRDHARQLEGQREKPKRIARQKRDGVE